MRVDTHVAHMADHIIVGAQNEVVPSFRCDLQERSSNAGHAARDEKVLDTALQNTHVSDDTNEEQGRKEQECERKTGRPARDTCPMKAKATTKLDRVLRNPETLPPLSKIVPDRAD